MKRCHLVLLTDGAMTHTHTLLPGGQGALQQAQALLSSTGCSCCEAKYTDKATVGSSIPMYNGMSTFAVCHGETDLGDVQRQKLHNQ